MSRCSCHDADAIVALIINQPADGGARVQNGLAHGLNRAPDVRADQIIGALKFCGAALFVIWQRYAQRRDAEAIEKTTQLHVALRLRVPLWKHNDRRTMIFASVSPPAARRRGKEVRVYSIIFRRRRTHGARPLELRALQTIVPNQWLERVEILAIFKDAPRVSSQ